jgi:hypothetical protein
VDKGLKTPIGGQPLEVVNEFGYLGAKISIDVLLHNMEINNIIAKVMGDMDRLQKQVRVTRCPFTPLNP